MAFETEFLEFMPYTVTITNPTGRSADRGLPTYVGATPASYRARIVGKILPLRMPENDHDEVTVVFDIYVNSGGDYISPEALVQLPAETVWQDQTPLLFAVARYTDPDGHHHTKLQCGYRYHRQGQ